MRGLVDPSLGAAGAEYFLVRTLIAPAACLLSIGVAWISPTFAYVSLVVVLQAHAAAGRRYRWPAPSEGNARV
jgi:hypothetical protein